MKTLSTLALALLVPVALNAATFEGTVKMKMTAPSGEPMPMTYRIKSGLSRIEMEAGGQQMVTIMDMSKQEATMLMPQQKMYMVHSLASAMEKAGEQSSDATLEKTSDHEKILGYDTTKYVAKSKGTVTEIWATEELGTFMGMSGGGPMGGRRGGRGNSAAQAWESVLRGKDVFPLRVVSKDANGKDSFRMEATEVKKESLPDSLFVPPADYQKFDMGGMMRGMGMPGMPGGGPRSKQN